MRLRVKLSQICLYSTELGFSYSNTQGYRDEQGELTTSEMSHKITSETLSLNITTERAVIKSASNSVIRLTVGSV